MLWSRRDPQRPNRKSGLTGRRNDSSAGAGSRISTSMNGLLRILMLAPYIKIALRPLEEYVRHIIWISFLDKLSCGSAFSFEVFSSDFIISEFTYSTAQALKASPTRLDVEWLVPCVQGQPEVQALAPAYSSNHPKTRDTFRGHPKRAP